MMNLEKQMVTVACMVVLAATMTVSGASREDPTTSHADNRTITGVWRTVVTPRNCQTGDAITSLSGLFTFNEGGTMSEYGIGPGSSPALRSPGHGVWRREHGWRNYSFGFIYYRYDASGVFVGSQRITATLKLRASGGEIATSSVIEILDASDNPIATGCATAVGTRFE